MTIRSANMAAMMLLLVSLVWGAEFVLIDIAIEAIPTHTFNTLRFALAALALLPLLIWHVPKTTRQHWPKQILAGAFLGFLLFIGFYTQTEGLRFTSVSNAGFITGLNVPLVPLLALIIFRQKVSNAVWLGAAAATIGLYLLTMTSSTEGGTTGINQGDLLVLLCAFAFAAHIVISGKLVEHFSVLPLSIIQLAAVAVYSGIAAISSDAPAFYYPTATPVNWQAQLTDPVILVALLVAALLGTAFAFWTQTSAQTILAPHKVALIFATEPVFAHIGGWLILDEQLSSAGFIGAGLIVAGMLIAELGDRNNREVTIEPLDHTSAVR